MWFDSFWKIVYLRDKIKNVTNKGFKPMLGAYPDFSNICLKYQPRYQKWYPTDITRNDIWGARYYPSWYPTPWYPKTMLDIKDVDIQPKYQIKGRISKLVVNK
jgi:hypothetical protein